MLRLIKLVVISGDKQHQPVQNTYTFIYIQCYNTDNGGFLCLSRTKVNSSVPEFSLKTVSESLSDYGSFFWTV